MSYISLVVIYHYYVIKSRDFFIKMPGTLNNYRVSGLKGARGSRRDLRLGYPNIFLAFIVDLPHFFFSFGVKSGSPSSLAL